MSVRTELKVNLQISIQSVRGFALVKFNTYYKKIIRNFYFKESELEFY